MDEFKQHVKELLESGLDGCSVDIMKDGSLEVSFEDADNQTHNFNITVTGS